MKTVSKAERIDKWIERTFWASLALFFGSAFYFGFSGRADHWEAIKYETPERIFLVAAFVMLLLCMGGLDGVLRFFYWILKAK